VYLLLQISRIMSGIVRFATRKFAVLCVECTVLLRKLIHGVTEKDMLISMTVNDTLFGDRRHWLS